MKTVLLITKIFALFFVVNICAQNSFQTFPSAGFKVKSGCQLAVNTTFIEMAKQQGVNNIVGAFLCAENEDEPAIGVINNINIYDESKSYKNLQPSDYKTFERAYLKQYATNLGNAGIEYNYTTYEGVSAIEYSFSQYGLPTKALVFLRNKRSYLIQVGTRKNLKAKYNQLKSSFKIF